MLTTIRRRFTAIAGVFAIVLALGVAYSPASALAGDDGCTNGTWVPDPNGGKHCDISSPGKPGDPGPVNGTNIVCTNNHITYQGQDYVCNLADGWSFSYGCYVKTVEPQPPASDPHWEGKSPETTRMQYISCGVMPPTVPGNREMHPGPCAVAGACGLDPVQGVTNQLAIDKPDLGMAPSGGPGHFGYVNQNVWFWSKGLDMSAQTRQAGNVVGLRTFVGAKWTIARTNPAAGTVATRDCTSDHEYTAADGGAPSPDPEHCGFQFKDPGDYTVTLTTTWSLLITQNGVAEPLQTVTSTPSTVQITILEGESTNG